MLVGDERASNERSTRRWWILAALVVSVGFIVFLELQAAHVGSRGPTSAFVNDLFWAPKRGRVIWAALAVALVGLTKRQRITVVAAAVAVDLTFFLMRLPGGERLTYGNGPFLVLIGLGLWALWQRSEQQRIDTLKGVGLGMALIAGTKISDTWLLITAKTKPFVADQFVQTADHALANLSWRTGELLQASGGAVQLVVETVYIELPVAAMVVAIFQLRKGWPSHHIVRSFLLVGLIGPLFYLLFPVVGPIYAYGVEGNGFELANVWPKQIPFHAVPESFRFDDVTPRNCMPSLHTAWSLLIFIHTRSGPRLMRAFGTFWFVVTLFATLALGYHYGVDLVAGVVFALAIEASLRAPERGWGWWRWRVVGLGAVLHGAMLFSFRYLSAPMAETPLVAGPLLLAAMGVMIVVFYATFFARPGTSLADWGQQRPPPATTTGSPVKASAEAVDEPAIG